MFAYLKGLLVEIKADHVILDVQGVGYLLFIPCRLMSELPNLGASVQFFTSFVIREFSQALYGFLNVEERDLFNTLLNVSGIGPKLGLSMIGHLSLKQLKDSIAQKDLATLCRVPGVGKKTAERLLVELKDKLTSVNDLSFEDLHIEGTSCNKQQIQDAILALMNLGYHQDVAHKAINESLKEIPDAINLSTLITTALKFTGR